MAALLQTEDVAHRFRGLQVLKGVSFAVEEASLTGLIGPNGAGKSTLFNIISGFLQPIAGEIVYMGSTITRLSVQRRSYAGLIRTFQTPQVFGQLTVRENLIAGCYKQGRTGIVESLLGLPAVRTELDGAARLADEACVEFGLAAVRDQLAGRLPAGQQRLVELARAAASKPRLLCHQRSQPKSSSGTRRHVIRDQLGARSIQRLRQAGFWLCTRPRGCLAARGGQPTHAARGRQPSPRTPLIWVHPLYQNRISNQCRECRHGTSVLLCSRSVPVGTTTRELAF